MNKFYIKKTKRNRIEDIKYLFLFWKGRKKGMIYTRDITLSDLRLIFFPKNFYEKYSYLGSVPYLEEKNMLHALTMALDGEAKPGWCPRWFLRFTHLFGNDKSLVRVRNWFWHNLHRKITKGVVFFDYKTKWSHYDLRLSVHGPMYLQDLAEAIELYTYRTGRREELLSILSNISEMEGKYNHFDTLRDLENKYEEYLNKYEEYLDKEVQSVQSDKNN
jgi:hypothetical protein